MHYVRVMITHESSPAGEQWVTHVYREDELNDMLANLRSLEARNIPFQQEFTRDPRGPSWRRDDECHVAAEMAEEAEDYNPEEEWF
jgi:hypothetical protein